MKILYGVQGTGNGHVSRARMMARHFNSCGGVKVSYLFSGRPRKDYFDMGIFGDFDCRKGLTFNADHGKINYRKTWAENSPKKFIREVKSLSLASYDLVLTDYEPVSAWAARRAGIPILGLGHQYAFDYHVPREGGNPASWFFMRNFAPVVNAFGLHWSSFGGKNLPPIVDPKLSEIAADLGTDKSKVVVYLPFENQREVTTILSGIPDFNFYQYSPGLIDEQHLNVSLRKTSHSGFIRDLCSAKAVICNAGFELVSEGLRLGLRVLVKPLKGQPEQLSNAAALVQLNLASRMDSLNSGEITRWLEANEAEESRREPIAYPDVAAALVDWITGKESCDASELVKKLWSECECPASDNAIDTAAHRHFGNQLAG